jgi:hypothetical protein
LQSLASVAAIDGIRSEGNGFGDVVGVGSGDQGGGGVQHDNIAARRTFACEHGPDDGSVLRGVASGDGVERCGLEAELFWRDLISADLAVTHFGDFRRTGNSDLVEAVATVYDNCAAKAELTEGFSELLYEIGGVDTDDLR